MTPRSSCPGEESTSSPGPKPPAHYRINTVTRNHGRNLALEPCHHPPSPASLARASATDRLVHFWESLAGYFWRAPKHTSAKCCLDHSEVRERGACES